VIYTDILLSAIQTVWCSMYIMLHTCPLLCRTPAAGEVDGGLEAASSLWCGRSRSQVCKFWLNRCVHVEGGREGESGAM
jgi:hypothetical protein